MRERGLCAAEVRESARARVYNSSRDTLHDIKLLTSQRNEVKSYHYKIIAFGLVRDRRTKELIVSNSGNLDLIKLKNKLSSEFFSAYPDIVAAFLHLIHSGNQYLNMH